MWIEKAVDYVGWATVVGFIAWVGYQMAIWQGC